MIKRLTIALLSTVLVLPLSACGDPCAGIKLTQRDQTAIDNGGEVERQGKRGVECEASDETGGAFVADD